MSYWFLFSVQMTYLAEVMSVKCQHCLRSQLEQMELCSQDLLSGGHCGQVEPELHLFTTHCSRIIKKTVNAKVFYSILYKGLIFFLKSRMHKQCLTSVEETAHSIPFQKVRVLGHTVHIGHSVVQIKHVLRRLLVSVDRGRILHSKNLQKPLNGSRSNFIGLVLSGEMVLQVV